MKIQELFKQHAEKCKDCKIKDCKGMTITNDRKARCEKF